MINILNYMINILNLVIIYYKNYIIIQVNQLKDLMHTGKIQKNSFLATLETALAKIPVFLPVSPLIIFWYFLVLIFVIIDFAFTVIFICFESEIAESILWDAILPIVLVIMGVDIIISFNISFIKNGRIVLDRRQIAKKYLFSFYFYLDVLAFTICFIQLVLQNIFQDQFTGLNFLIYVKVIKGAEFDRLIKKYVLKSASLILYYQMIKNLVLLILVCHTIGSFFYYLDLVLIEAQWYTPQNLWINSSYAYLNINQLPVGYQYAYSFYYAVVTLSGTAYGDLVPLNQTQTAYTFGAIALPMIVYAYLFSVIYNAISQRRNQAIQATKYKKTAKYYFRDLGIDKNLSIKLMNYLTYVYEKKISVDNDFLSTLAPSLRDEYIKTVVDGSYDFSIFHILCRPEFQLQHIKNIVYKIIEQQSLPDGYVISHKRHQIKLFFINSGKMFELVELKQKKFIKSKRKGKFLMLHPFFSGINSMHKNNRYEVKSFTVCQVIDHTQFMKYVRVNQILRESYSMLRDQIISGDSEILKQQCFFCDSTQHILAQCPKLKLSVDITQPLNARVKRNQLNYYKFYYRKNYHTRSSKFVSGHENKLRIHKSMKQQFSIQFRKGSLLSEEQLTSTASTQTADLGGQKWRIEAEAPQEVERVKKWKVYFPAFNSF